MVNRLGIVENFIYTPFCDPSWVHDLKPFTDVGTSCACEAKINGVSSGHTYVAHSYAWPIWDIARGIVCGRRMRLACTLAVHDSLVLALLRQCCGRAILKWWEI